ncbi:MAG: T9SS type A sorting domain-containing protein [Bacteroidales bacterium]|nr:T9SS type A sorting domain-containing protein [Bacteroidales bacterium]MDD2577734.1 T9SS type A sorting domain-containing protein [Bacteroidales bacterium]MDD4068667.1 T9SS type A sorting domain-containing protein [Bacteroidales bacterium]
MKKVLFILVICLISLSSKICYSQEDYVPPIVKIDSITQDFPQGFNTSIFASFTQGTDSIIEKGLEIKGVYSQSFLHLSINNDNFDTTLFFIPEVEQYWVVAFVRTDTSIIKSDSSSFLTASVDIPKTTLNNNSIKIYPTIIDKEINISSDKYPISLSVIDLFGREVLRKEIYNNRAIDLDFLKKGTYILKLKHKDTIINRKIIKK